MQINIIHPVYNLQIVYAANEWMNEWWNQEDKNVGVSEWVNEWMNEHVFIQYVLDWMMPVFKEDTLNINKQTASPSHILTIFQIIELDFRTSHTEKK